MAGEHSNNDWFAVGAYALVAAVSQMLWLTYAPITTESAAHFGVSEDAVGWLAQIFPLLYVVLAIPAGLLLDRWLRQTLIGAAGLMLAGAAIRLAGSGFELALAGQILIAIAQPAVLAAVTKLAAERVDEDQRTTAIAIGSAGVFLGLVLALVLGAVIGADNQLRPLLTINLAVAAVAFVVVAFALRSASERESDESAAISRAELKRIYTDPVLSRLGAMIFIGMGVFNALATWLEVLLEPAGVSSSATSWILVAMSVSGIFGAILLSPRVSARGSERGFLQVAALAGAAAFLLMTAVHADVMIGLVLAVVGFFLLGAQPVILEISERRAGHAAASAAGAILLAGNLGGIVLAVLVQTINGHPSASFIVLAAAMLLIAPIARSLAPGFNARAT
ncbi:MAG: MFS transporter [Thermoleophilaceae bacterium]|nr:MFS transporter [Thermoleophilaceae bacterium]